ncbi:MAG: hypothetical protein IJC63_08575 [Myxococcaceae bacterium]|nr:hypothetical protein [Myxococcaceae bacterium]MBR2979413.1 hypothetical protein [Myxococcaceae bacterium]
MAAPLQNEIPAPKSAVGSGNGGFACARREVIGGQADFELLSAGAWV